MAIALAAALTSPCVALAATNTQSLHRLYNPNSGEHFYTASAGERDLLVAAGWRAEGIGWYGVASTNGNAAEDDAEEGAADAGDANNKIFFGSSAPLRNFAADGDAFFVGDEAEITFTVDAANVESDTYLYDGASDGIGKMHDDGQDGDTVANDGTLTYVLKTVAKEESSVHYFAKTEDAASNQVLVRADAGRHLRRLHLLAKPRRRPGDAQRRQVLWPQPGHFVGRAWRIRVRYPFLPAHGRKVRLVEMGNEAELSRGQRAKRYDMLRRPRLHYPKFIDKYCGDLSGDLVYIGACESGKDSALADAFLNKGATAVVANSDLIYGAYDLKMENTIITRMTKVNSKTGNYYTLGEALNVSKGMWGKNDAEWAESQGIETDGTSAEILIFGGDNARNLRFANKE